MNRSIYSTDDITWEQFEQKFVEAFGREMTPDERHWFHSIWTVVRQKHQRANAVAA